MEFDELLITTGVDALVRLVKEKERIELEEAASILNIAPEMLEEWARVLEEEGILRIEYRLTKIYMAWVKPTEAEIATEVSSFKEEKKGIEAEVELVSRRVAEGTGGLEDLRRSFAEFYAKAYPRMEALEKAVAPIPAGKTISDAAFAKQAAALVEMSAKLETLRRALGDIRKDVDSLAVERRGGESKAAMERIDKMSADLSSMEEELGQIRKRASQQGAGEGVLPSVTDMRKKLDVLRKEFTDMRGRNAKLRQDMISLQESSQILKEVAESIMGHEGKVETLRSEMEALAAETDKLMERANGLSATVKGSLELAERYGESINVAKGILSRFPSQEKVMTELETLKTMEEKLIEKTDALEKLLEAAGGKQVTAKQFTELTKRMDDKAVQIRKDMDVLATALEDEKATYLAFQKIKEKVVPSIEGYQKQLDDMTSTLAKMKQDIAGQQTGLRDEAKKVQEAMKGQDMQSAMKLAQDIRDRKKSLDDIRQTLEELTTTSDNLNKRITLLSREAKLLEIRTGAPAEATAKEKELKQQLELSAEEEMEFKKKREELKNLIKKLWE